MRWISVLVLVLVAIHLSEAFRMARKPADTSGGDYGGGSEAAATGGTSTDGGAGRKSQWSRANANSRRRRHYRSRRRTRGRGSSSSTTGEIAEGGNAESKGRRSRRTRRRSGSRRHVHSHRRSHVSKKAPTTWKKVEGTELVDKFINAGKKELLEKAVNYNFGVMAYYSEKFGGKYEELINEVTKVIGKEKMEELKETHGKGSSSHHRGGRRSWNKEAMIEQYRKNGGHKKSNENNEEQKRNWSRDRKSTKAYRGGNTDGGDHKYNRHRRNYRGKNDMASTSSEGHSESESSKFADRRGSFGRKGRKQRKEYNEEEENEHKKSSKGSDLRAKFANMKRKFRKRKPTRHEKKQVHHEEDDENEEPREMKAKKHSKSKGGLNMRAKFAAMKQRFKKGSKKHEKKHEEMEEDDHESEEQEQSHSDDGFSTDD